MKQILVFLLILDLSLSQRCPGCKDYYCLEDIWKDCPQTLVNSNITNISNASINCITVQYIEAEQDYRQLKDCVIGREEENCELFYQKYGIQNVNCTVIPPFFNIQSSLNQSEKNDLTNSTANPLLPQGLNLNLSGSSPYLNLNLNPNSSISSSESLSYSYDEIPNLSYLNLSFSSRWNSNLSFNSTEDFSNSSSDLNYGYYSLSFNSTEVSSDASEDSSNLSLDLSYSYDLILESNSSFYLNESDFLLSNSYPIIAAANPVPIYNFSLNQNLNFTSTEEDTSSDLSYSYDLNSNSNFNLTFNENEFLPLNSDPVIISSNPVLSDSGNLTSTEDNLSFNYDFELNLNSSLNLVSNENYSLSSNYDQIVINPNITSYQNSSFGSTHLNLDLELNPNLDLDVSNNILYPNQADVKNVTNHSSSTTNFTDPSFSSSLESFLDPNLNQSLTPNSEIDVDLNSGLQNLEQANSTDSLIQTTISNLSINNSLSSNLEISTFSSNTNPTIISFSSNTIPSSVSDATFFSESPGSVSSTTSNLTDLDTDGNLTLSSDPIFSFSPYQDLLFNFSFRPTSSVFTFDSIEPGVTSPSNSNENNSFGLNPNFTISSFSSNTDPTINLPFFTSTTDYSETSSSSVLSFDFESDNLNSSSPTLALDPNNYSYNFNQDSTVSPSFTFDKNYSLNFNSTSNILGIADTSSSNNFESSTTPLNSNINFNFSSNNNLDLISSSSNLTGSSDINFSRTSNFDNFTQSSNPTSDSNVSFVSSISPTQTIEPVLRPSFGTRPSFLNQNSGLTSTPTTRSNSSFRIDPNINFNIPSRSNSSRSNFTSNTTPSLYSILRNIFSFNFSTTPSTNFNKKLNETFGPRPTSPSYTSRVKTGFTFNWIPDRHFIPTPSINNALKTTFKPKKSTSHINPELKPSPDSASGNTVNLIIEILILFLSIFELY
ncbi:uncharacterized threonine-rich GPI-anchored glycoprotein PJ4664.02-like isoform X2 [Tribolium madens]|uniref:uncharacterized threonine-rich GPI-anchored glycoprotein PJ4664.02-like isoform X2 n=1 Tax=Tribolium madens TaxID=41895 RepID=UPI001CF74EC0|nr:uncharacterized threonine-rich GPI-anchored glycoprotein PJ4664.02-like isoform X2 [Tribolium madens]